jgi:hypothetical protein
MGGETFQNVGSLAEWLTRCPAKALLNERAGSNPAAVVTKANINNIMYSFIINYKLCETK